MKTLLAIVLLLSANAYAERNYISGVQKITFRTGPGTDNKIIKMLETHTKVELVEAKETWSKIKDADGNEGYVLNRFLTKDVPYTLRYKWLKSKHDKLQESFDKKKISYNELKTKLAETETKLKEVAETLAKVQAEYTSLKEGSADYIGLKAKYDETVKSLTEQSAKVEKLESSISVYYIKWFLAGSGVLFLGWVIGLFSRKKKSYSGLSF